MTNRTGNPSVRNITRVFRNASQRDLLVGMDWYSRANRLAAELDPTNVRRAAGCIAAMSPLNSWPVNMMMVREVYAGGKARGLGRNVAKCHRIYNGEDPAIVLSGPKVRAFFFTIADPSNAEAVTVDRHAIDIACGMVQNDTDRSRAIRGKSGYAMVADMYVRAAGILSKEYGVTIYPHQVQAVTWIAWRNTHRPAFKGDW